MTEWFSPQSIKYTPEQVRFLIPVLYLLHAGVYPRDAKETGYTGNIRVKQFRSGGKHELAAGIAAELTWRIQKCGIDGLLLELLLTTTDGNDDFFINHMAMTLKESRYEIYRRISSALTYVCGDSRKEISYAEHCAGQISETVRKR